MADYHEIYTAHVGELPQPCEFCSQPVTCWGQARDEGVIHHRDEDHGNDEPSNLTAAHQGCHVSYHATKQVRPHHPPGVHKIVPGSIRGAR